MKSIMLSFIVSLVCVSAFAGVPMSVKSTSDQIEVFSPQSRAVTIAQLCEILDQDNLDWGKNGSIIRCFKLNNGLIELRGNNESGTYSIYANANDKTVYEDFGDSPFQRYQNNLGQSLVVQFNMVTTSVRNVRGASHVNGYFQVDAMMRGPNNVQLRLGISSRL